MTPSNYETRVRGAGTRFKTRLEVQTFDNGTASYCLRRDDIVRGFDVILKFYITAQGWMIGSGGDMRTARRLVRSSRYV